MKSNILPVDFFVLSEEDMVDDPLQAIPAELLHLMPGFIERREKEVQDLLQMLHENDFMSIRGIGHRLKGTGAGYGLQLISDLGSALEEAAFAQDGERVKEVIDQLTIVTVNLKRLLTPQ